ncbi:Fukutin [Aphelenchoides avenae]|nr:Fukutin [Aphelenchus avenae]
MMPPSPEEPFTLPDNMIGWYATWAPAGPCHGRYASSSCVFGVGDLPVLYRRGELMAHKLYLDTQPAAFFCLYERVRLRAFDPLQQRFRATAYAHIPQLFCISTKLMVGFMASRLRQILAAAAAATLCYVILYASLSVNTNMHSTLSATEYHDSLLVDERCLRNILRNVSCAVPVRLAVRRQQVSNLGAAGNVTIAYVEDDPAKDYLVFTVNDYLLSPDEHKRAVVRYNMTKRRVTLSNGQYLDALVPESIPTFLRRWRRGRFLRCKPVLTRAANVPRVIPLNFVETVGAFRDFCDTYNVTCFLCGGSLLGWYRECSIVPHTTDFDFAAFPSEHTEQFLQAFIDSNVFRLRRILGRLNDSLELTVRVNGYQIDLFYLYEDARRGAEYMPGMDRPTRRQLRWYQPKTEGICAGDLLGKLVHVPCNPIDALTATYGDFWFEDHPTSSYDWLRSAKNVEFGEIYSSAEWPSVIREYNH